MYILRIMAVFAIAVAVAPPAEVQAAKGIPGVHCDGGFFARLPGTRIGWVNTDRQLMVKVYDGPHPIVGLVQCGPGVVAVFNTAGERSSTPSYEAFYSSTCRAIGGGAEGSERVYSGPDAITKVETRGDGIVTTFANGERWYSANCRALDAAPSERLE